MIICCPSELILREVPAHHQIPHDPEEEEEELLEEPEEDSPGLFAGYRKRRKMEATTRPESPETQLANYLSLDTTQISLTFWERNRKSLPCSTLSGCH